MNTPLVKRDERGRLTPGSHLNDRGHPKNVIAELRGLLTPHLPEFVDTLLQLLRSPDEKTKLAALEIAFDRTAGKPQVLVDQTTTKLDLGALYLEAVKAANQPIDITPADGQADQTETTLDGEW
jgi:hypothetical protein